MRILHRYVLREVSLQALLGLLIFTFVVFMQQLGKLLELTVQANSFAAFRVLLDVLPSALVLTLPMALLVGILIGLGRLGVDSELVAMRAAGLGSSRLVLPLLGLTGAVLALALSFTLWLAPAAYRDLARLQTDIAASAFDVQPRVFLENQPPYVIYAGETLPGGRWRQVLVADMTDPKSPRLTMANAGELAHLGPRLFQLHLEQGASYETPPDRPDRSYTSSWASTDIPIDIGEPRLPPPNLNALPLRELWTRAKFGDDWRNARVQYYRRFSLAFSCLALALVGIPLGLRSGRGGRAGGFVLTLALVFVYYLVYLFGLRLGQQGTVPPWLGAWAGNLAFFALGIWMLCGLDRHQASAGVDPVARLRAMLAARRRRTPRTARAYHHGWMPSLLEGYLMREFLGYTALLLGSFLLLVLVFTAFELTGDILHNQIPFPVVLRYLLYLAPQMAYVVIPVAILLGVLITFGLMSKANEITALKACGVSAYRLVVPILALAAVLGGLQFALDATWLPDFNRKQEALHDRIKGRPPETHLTPEWQWVFGEHNDIYYFHFFDATRQQFAELSVFEFDPATFTLTRRLYASGAQWDSQLNAWVLSRGWDQGLGASPGFHPFLAQAFPDLREAPAYFTADLSHQGTEMSYSELQADIAGLQKAGYNVSRLSVQLNKKIAYPAITLVMALLAFPFALTVGRRGTVAGIAGGIGIAIGYLVAADMLEALGNLSQLPAFLAAWTPDLIFLLASFYLLLRVPT